MRRSSAQNEGGRSLRTFFFFCFVVLLLILVSLGIRLYYLFQESSFDGEHRFTIEIRHTDKERDIATFEPLSGSIDIFAVSGKENVSLTEDFGVPIDGVIYDKGERLSKQNLLSKLYQYMFRITSGDGVNSLDVARIVLFAYGVDRSKISSSEIRPEDISTNEIFDEVFLDSALVDENKTIAIINAAGEPGLAGRVERILNRLGGNVVSVTTAPMIEKYSRIEYGGENSYTLFRIQKVVKFPLKETQDIGISDILIVLGEDSIPVEEE
jgi:hypothetical protein